MVTSLMALAIEAVKRLPPAAQDELAARIVIDIARTEREQGTPVRPLKRVA